MKMFKLRTKVEIMMIAMLILVVSFSSIFATQKYGEDSTGQTWFGPTGNEITCSNGKSFPATGDGLQDAINENVTVYMPSGTIVLPVAGIKYYHNTHIVGQGMGVTILDASVCVGYAISPCADPMTYAIIEPCLEGFTLDGKNVSVGHGINYRDTWNGILRDIKVQYFIAGSGGMVIDGGTQGASGLKAYNCFFNVNNFGVSIINSGVSFCTINSFYGCTFVCNINNGIDIRGSGGGAIVDTLFENCQIEANGVWGVRVGDTGGSVGTRFYNCFTEGNNLSGLGGQVWIGSAAYNVEFVGGLLTESTGCVRLIHCAGAGYGPKFQNLNEFNDFGYPCPYDLVIRKVDTNSSQYVLYNGTNGNIIRAGDWTTIFNQAVTESEYQNGASIWAGELYQFITNSNFHSFPATSAGLQSAIWELNHTGGTVWIPTSFKTFGTFTPIQNNITLIGYGNQTDNWGNVSIAAGASTKTFNHNLSVMPSNVQVTVRGNSTCANGQTSFDVRYTTTTITIEMRGKLVAECHFMWYAKV